MYTSLGYLKILQYQGVLFLTSFLLNNYQVLGTTLYNTGQETFRQSSITINNEEVAQNLIYPNSLAQIMKIKGLTFPEESIVGLPGNFQAIVSSFKQLKLNGNSSDYNIQVRILPRTDPSDIFKNVYYSAIVTSPINTEQTIENLPENSKFTEPNSGGLPNNKRQENNFGLPNAPISQIFTSTYNRVSPVLTQIRQFGNLNIREISSLPRYSALGNLSNVSAYGASYTFRNNKITKYNKNNTFEKIPLTESIQIKQEMKENANRELERSTRAQTNRFRQLVEQETQREKLRQQQLVEAQKRRAIEIQRISKQNQDQAARTQAVP